jgi:hypothetical protein
MEPRYNSDAVSSRDGVLQSPRRPSQRDVLTFRRALEQASDVAAT